MHARSRPLSRRATHIIALGSLALALCALAAPPARAAATSVATGDFASCAIRADATLACWGAATAAGLGTAATASVGDDEQPGGGSVDLGPTSTVKAVAVSSGNPFYNGGHACAIRTDDTVVCWGTGADGRLGYGDVATIGDDEAPGPRSVDLGSVDTAEAIAVGDRHSCAIRTDDTVVCWGFGFEGALGYGNTDTIGDGETPGSRIVDLGSVDTATAISASAGQTCAIRSDATVVCWGQGALGYNGRIGDNETPAARTVDLGTADTAKAVTIGSGFACAIRTDDSVACWGSGTGVLGYGNSSSFTSPGGLTVNLGGGAGAKAISAGNFHVCAARTSGTVVCWGAYGGGLGYGSTETIGDDEVPGTRVVDLGPAATVNHLAAGGKSTCAVRATGSVVCWGSSDFGQLGNGLGTRIGDDEAPGLSEIALDGSRSSPSARAVPADRAAATAVDSGNADACAIRTDRTLTCWGQPYNGRTGGGAFGPLGPGEFTVWLGPVSTVSEVSAGEVHTCALRTDATIACFGLNVYGQTGSGAFSTSQDGSVDIGGAARQISAGGLHTCAVRTSGTVVCWGSGFSGALGYGDTTTIGDNEVPGTRSVDLGPVDTAKQVSAGGGHTCAIRTDDTVVCWGDGSDGRLGYGDTTRIGDTETPGSRVVDLGAVDTAKRISAGATGTCAIRTDDTLVCWGSGARGQLGYGDSASIGDGETPGARVVDLGSSDAAKDVQMGDHTCAIRANDTLACWGLGATGQLGYGATASIGDDETPGNRSVDLGALDTVKSVAPSIGGYTPSDHTCAVRTDGKTFCWGFSPEGLGFDVLRAVGDDESPGSAGFVDLGPAVAADTTPPAITIARPAPGEHFALGAVVVPAFGCEDGDAGVQSCSAPSAVDTSSAGTKTFTVEAIDKAGNAATRSVTYIVDEAPADTPPPSGEKTSPAPAPAMPIGPAPNATLTFVLRPAALAAPAISRNARVLSVTVKQVPKGTKLVATIKGGGLSLKTTKTAAKAGRVVLTFELSSKQRRAIKRRSLQRLSVTVTAQPPGAPSTRATTTIKFKR